MAALGFEEGVGNFVQGIRPGNVLPPAPALGTFALERSQQTIRMMNPLSIAANLFTNDAGGVAVGFGAAHASDGV